MFDGRVSSPKLVMPADVRRVPRSAVRVDLKSELCAWCVWIARAVAVRVVTLNMLRVKRSCRG